MNNQLQAPITHLLDLGFEYCGTYPILKNKTINGYFYYNFLEKKDTWYHRTILGESQNDVLLNIQSKADLENVLRVFGVLKAIQLN